MEGIHDGDLIAVDRSGKARVGRIVLAVVDGSITLKKLAKRDGQYWLDPKSKGNNYQPIRITDQTEIWGVIARISPPLFGGLIAMVKTHSPD
ncbi:S24 family peptidase [Klebsiella pneumoniae subsp. pneumoniae]|nr:S24 family peptidase [Klebsiella pneumoniae subsp. pneumoniae]